MSITVKLQTCPDNGGAHISLHELLINEGTDGSDFDEANLYDKSGSLMEHTFDTTNMPTLSSNLIYQVKFRCYNIKGYSEDSEILYVTAHSPPLKPATPTVNYAFSSNSSLYVQWALNSDVTGPGGKIKGYKLYADDGRGGLFKMIYSTVDVSPAIDHYLFTGLTKALPYRFRLEAYNFNGPSSYLSNIATYMPCNTPSRWSKPSRISSTESSITVRWNEP